MVTLRREKTSRAAERSARAIHNTHSNIYKFVRKREQMCTMWREREREEEEKEKNITAQGMKCRENRIETWSRALRALSTSRLGSPCRHLRDVTRGNSWSLFSYLVCSPTTFAFRERGNLSHLPSSRFPSSSLLIFSPFPLRFYFLLDLSCTLKATFHTCIF